MSPISSGGTGVPSTPSLPHRGPGCAEGDEQRLGHEVGVREQGHLRLVDDDRVGERDDVGRQGGIRGEVDDDAGTRVTSGARGPREGLEVHLERAEQHVTRPEAPGRRHQSGVPLAVGAGDDDDRVLAVVVHGDEGGAGGRCAARRDGRAVDAEALRAVER